jgi:hypothetical protein
MVGLTLRVRLMKVFRGQRAGLQMMSVALSLTRFPIFEV